MTTETVAKPLPYSRVFINSGDPIEQEVLMEFRLLYGGALLSSGNNSSRSPEKHAIRRSFHPQLRRVWQTHKVIRQFATTHIDKAAFPDRSDEEHVEAGIAAIGKQWHRAGYDFVPLVVPGYFLRCSLDILLLRPGEDKFIFKMGDIDGQLKTLLDALQIPDNLDAVGGSGPQEDETPFYCLLSNDRLITEVRVTTDELLMLPAHQNVKATDAFVVIHVKINNVYPGTVGAYWG
jgi:hypothetical protein